FEIKGVFGSVQFRPVGPQGWTLKSVTLNGTDITDRPYDIRAGADVNGLEIVLTDRLSTLTGTVRNSRGEAVKEYVVAILPEHLDDGVLSARIIRTVRPDQNGQYKTTGLPPGDYTAFAVESIENGGLYDPAYQQAMQPRGKSVHIDEGRATTLDLQLVQ